MVYDSNALKRWFITGDLPKPTNRKATMPTHNPWTVAEAVLKESKRVLLRGKPGTGKTYAAKSIGLRPDQKIYQLTMTPETPMAEIRGHFVQKGGEFIWHDGPAIRAWREAARLVVNEIDRAGEDVLSLLYAILDDPEFAELTLPTGETVRPKEGFAVVATMNGVPDDLPDGLQDRLPVDIHITEMAQGALDRLPEDLRDPAKNTALADNPERNISIRMWMEFAGLRESFKDKEGGLMMAAQAVFGEKAPEALAALDIAGTADPAIDMEGKEIPENFLRSVRDWISFAVTWGHNSSLIESAEKDLKAEAVKAIDKGLIQTCSINLSHSVPSVTIDGKEFTPESWS